MNLPKSESAILQQIKTEYRLGFDYMYPKRIESLNRYRIYSNQKKDKELVSHSLAFTVFQTVHSKLYDDKLSVQFEPGHPDDTQKVDALNPAARYDYYKMGKDQLDFDWDWYAGFWGSGFLDVSEWDAKKTIMRPSVVNNATLIIDPDGTLVNGDQRGFGAFRFWSREIAKTKPQMGQDGFLNFKDLKPSQDYNSLAHIDKVFRRQAQNTTIPAAQTDYDNDYIPLLEHWTHIGNEKWLFTCDLSFTRIVKAKRWWSDKWPLIQRKLFPIPNDPLGVSIMDLVEDKHRALSVLTNLGLNMAKADLYPMYVYDRNVISPTADLSFDFNKWIPADGNPREGVTPLQKPAVGQIVSFIMDAIDQTAQKATAASNMQQGVMSEAPRSANEVVRVFNQAEERISTAAKVFGWSEREFWTHWLSNTQHYMTSLHQKFVRIDGPFGPKFQVYSGDDFKLEDNPDIYIESKVLSDAKNQDAKNDAIAFTNIIAQDQSVNRSYWNKRTAKLFGVSSEEIDRLFPPTPDELQARQENERLSDNKLVKISIDDDHLVHLLTHANVEDTKAAIVHIEAHKKALMIKRQMQMQNPETPQNPTELPTSTQTTPNLNGQGSAPAPQAGNNNTVQQ